MEYTPNDFYNRELSWIQFNKRVVSEADSNTNPMLEKLKFLAITSSNFDEFFKVRVAGLKTQEESELKLKDLAGLLPKEQLKLIKKEVENVVSIQYEYYHKLMDSLNTVGHIKLKKYSELEGKELRFIENYYDEIIYPLLTPMAVDTFRPFPHLNSGAINIILHIKEKNNKKDLLSFAILEVPRGIDRIIKLPGDNNFILLEEVIQNDLKELFESYEILNVGYFRITRDEGLEVDENNEAEDLLIEVEKEIRNRRWGKPVRVEFMENISKKSLEFLKENLGINNDELYLINGPLDLNFLWKISGVNGLDNLKFKKNTPKFYKEFEGEKIFKVLSEKNILLRHPFESFDHVIDLIETAAKDPNVLAIKQTLYRVSGDSLIIKYLKLAAENGKQVTVLVELKARFDEERNVKWARQLEEAGCHVIYGLSGLKTHAKCLLIIRKEHDGVKRYIHLGTGNYNGSTSKLYVDYSFFTKDEEIGLDVSNLFNKLTGFFKLNDWKKILIAPTSLRKGIYSLIDREIEHVKAGNLGKITIKTNGFTDKGIIEKLYDASKVGVKIDLIVRGASCLKSGIKGLSENINVYSVVGRFLEHDRIYCFHNNGDESIYLGSADCMSRNLDRRIETLFPIEQKKDQKNIKDLLKNILKDRSKLRIQNQDGTYSLVTDTENKNNENFNYQEHYVNLLKTK